MKRSHSRSQVLLWILSVFVALSMILGLVASIIPQSGPASPASAPVSFHFAVGGESVRDPVAYSRFLSQVAEDDNLFLVHTGDLTADGSESSFQEFGSQMANFQLPFFPVPGEDDYHEGTLDNFRRYTGTTGVHYAFDYGSVHLAMVNVAQRRVTPETLAWLRADLVASEQSVKMVFLHYPPLTLPGVPSVILSQSDALVALIQEQDVDWVFAGHAPGYRETEHNGTKYVVTSAPDPSLDQGPQDGNFHHYVRVTVQGTDVAIDVVPIAVG